MFSNLFFLYFSFFEPRAHCAVGKDPNLEERNPVISGTVVELFIWKIVNSVPTEAICKQSVMHLKEN